MRLEEIGELSGSKLWLGRLAGS